MQYANNGKRDVPRLSAGVSGHSIRYADFESAFLRFLDQLDWTQILDVSESDDLKRVLCVIRAHLQWSPPKFK